MSTTNEWIISRGVSADEECLSENYPNERIADNYESCLRHSLVNNDLIMENVLEWLKTSQLIECSRVCLKWHSVSQLIASKRQYFLHKLLYFQSLSSGQSSPVWRDRYLNIFKDSLGEVIHGYNHYLSRNGLNEFKLIILFSKLDFNELYEFLDNHYIPDDCIVLHINCRNEVIGSPNYRRPSGLSIANYQPIEYESDFDMLSGISALCMSGSMPGIQLNFYKDSNIYNIKADDQLKCILMFHIWRSFYGHFSRLKTDSQYLEYLEELIGECNNNVAFAGATVDRLAISQTTTANSTDNNLNNYQFIDYICCVTISGDNVRAFSYVLDFNDPNIGNQLKLINQELSPTFKANGQRIESIGLVFTENARQVIKILREAFENKLKLMGCSGVSHGLNNTLNANHSENVLFKRGKCVLLVLQLNKTLNL